MAQEVELVLGISNGQGTNKRSDIQALVQEMLTHDRDRSEGLWQAMQEENEEQARLCKTKDYAEGFRALQEKREPKFTGSSR